MSKTRHNKDRQSEKKGSAYMVSADSVVNGCIKAETAETLDDGTVVYTNATVTAA